MTTTRTIDATGTWCPVPVGLLRRAAARADDGDIIEVLADDPLAAVDIPAWCHSAGHEVLVLDQQGRVITTRVRISRPR
jgi:TusA-related sulfurtransferase